MHEEAYKLYPAPAYLDEEKILAGIRNVLAQFNGENRRKLTGTCALRIPIRLLGVWLQPPNRFGQRSHLLKRHWKESLAAAGTIRTALHW